MNPKILGDVKQMKTELWIMNTDGSNRQRLTFFNEPGKVGYTGENLVFGDSCWSPDGSRILAYVLFRPRQQLGRLVMLTLREVQVKPDENVRIESQSNLVQKESGGNRKK